ncbi:hypothetical protein LEP1GSC185_2548 [Leptospira licerasiae serovar Varillal str. VAR 010]|uniref:Uncharacterized protein n=1 Tax=Leptospira licerasiae str. MMD4847 TaxID=1049971 RepID=A0ABN0H8R6_9LEPT|nr:hypothetical protein LEP1GSC185_2548 [Leptospira licerasiae serovar Varillal str. VAR 010]EJZ41976.1 hypothetical protein LEP1GSC178_0322 [Leptospira licerasiae str. MMD4847]
MINRSSYWNSNVSESEFWKLQKTNNEILIADKPIPPCVFGAPLEKKSSYVGKNI